MTPRHEVNALTWRTSSYTGSQGNCVEVADTAEPVLVRDTKDRAGGTLSFGRRQWQAFLSLNPR